MSTFDEVDTWREARRDEELGGKPTHRLIFEIDARLIDPAWTAQELRENAVDYLVGMVLSAETKAHAHFQQPPYRLSAVNGALFLSREDFQLEHDSAMKPVHTPDGVKYLPWTNGYSIGYQCVFDDDRPDEYLYLNPSSESDDGVPNVFVYQGPQGDPAIDEAHCFINVGTEEQA